MTKKKNPKKIYVKKPKVGQSYWFWFAGTITFGELYDDAPGLTKHYGEPWYMLIDKKGTKYPVSIFVLRYDRPTYKQDV
jgi:hypothetical protein